MDKSQDINHMHRTSEAKYKVGFKEKLTFKQRTKIKQNQVQPFSVTCSEGWGGSF